MSIFKAAVAPVSDGTLPSVHCILLFGLRPTILFGPRPLNLGLVPFGLCPVFGPRPHFGLLSRFRWAFTQRAPLRAVMILPRSLHGAQHVPHLHVFSLFRCLKLSARAHAAPQLLPLGGEATVPGLLLLMGHLLQLICHRRPGWRASRTWLPSDCVLHRCLPRRLLLLHLSQARRCRPTLQ